MNLDEAQRKKVTEWVGQGLRLSEIQSRLASELGVRLTYMDVRLLVDDLKLTPKDIEPAKPAPTLNAPAHAATPARGLSAKPSAQRPSPEPSAPAGVSVSVDQITRPGAVVSGKVTFSDGNQAQWYFDQTGRLALISQQPGYRPPAEDLQEFQSTLENELSRLGL